MVLRESEIILASFLFTRTFGRILTKYTNTVVPNGKTATLIFIVEHPQKGHNIVKTVLLHLYIYI